MNEQLIFDGRISITAQHLTEIMTQLNDRPAVAEAILATTDGLAVGPPAPNTSQSLAAIAGFMTAAARQSRAMLNLPPINAVTIHMEDGRLFVCQTFPMNGLKLILAVLFQDTRNYQDTLNQTITAIKTEVELNSDPL